MSHFAKRGSELGMSVAVLVVLAVLIHPYWMPMGLVVVFIAVLAALVFGLAVFVWREKPKDEREYAAVGQTGRTAYLVGSLILTLGVAIQTLQHDVDIWLVIALAAMVLSKVLSHLKTD